MLKKVLYMLWLVGSVAALILLAPRWTVPEAEPESLFILRVWNAEKEPAVSAWLRKRASAYEKEAGIRVYVRAVSGAEMAVIDSQKDAPRPDLLVSETGSVTLAWMGYALFVRDEQAEIVTPAPTGALFFHPSPVPGPTPEPEPWPEGDVLSAVLSPQTMMNALPGTVSSAQPVSDFLQGKAKAALLTAGQAAQLTFGYRVYALPDGKWFADIKAQAFSEQGEDFLQFLLSDASQQALGNHGLYSPRLLLYQPSDTIRYLIDRSRAD